MQFTFCPLYSGSSGNALFVAGGNTRILVDAGLSGKTVTEALRNVCVLPEQLNGIVVTHEHSDHIKGVGILSRKYHIPVYANERTWSQMARLIGPVEPACVRTFETDCEFYIGELALRGFPIPHDAIDPVGYRIYYRAKSLSIATDLGNFNKSVCNNISGSDLILLESNHDPNMLKDNPHYSAQLKQRILGNHGHLSNDACATALLRLLDTGVTRFVLGHLSGENNTPELAMNTSVSALAKHGIVPNEDACVDMAWRDHVGNVYTIE